MGATGPDPYAAIAEEEIRIPGSAALRFEGTGHGSGISFFLVATAPGEGPALHRHPYDETFHVIQGAASIVLGEQTLAAGPGDTVVVPPQVWHRFTSSGPEVLRMVCIHASPVMIQEFAAQT